jgi:guanylate kinase
MAEKGKLIILSGPSGCGKGTVLAEYEKKHGGFYHSVSVTTRAPRPGEIPGVSYDYISRDQFEQLIQNHGLLEYNYYGGKDYYGTPAKPVLEHLEQGQDVLLEIDINGAQQVKQSYPDAIMIFMMTPTYAKLEDQLRGRKTESETDVEKRLARGREEILSAWKYEYILINETVEDTAEKLYCIIGAAGCDRVRSAFTAENLMKDVLKSLQNPHQG